MLARILLAGVDWLDASLAAVFWLLWYLVRRLLFVGMSNRPNCGGGGGACMFCWPVQRCSSMPEARDLVSVINKFDNSLTHPSYTEINTGKLLE